MKCPRCQGKGRFIPPDMMAVTSATIVDMECTLCKGKGEVGYEDAVTGIILDLDNRLYQLDDVLRHLSGVASNSFSMINSLYYDIIAIKKKLKIRE